MPLPVWRLREGHSPTRCRDWLAHVDNLAPSSRTTQGKPALAGAHPGTGPETAGVLGAPDSDPARFNKTSIHAGSESGTPGAVPPYVISVAQPSRLRVRGASRPVPQRATRRRPNSQARTPALPLGPNALIRYPAPVGTSRCGVPARAERAEPGAHDGRNRPVTVPRPFVAVLHGRVDGPKLDAKFAGHAGRLSKTSLSFNSTTAMLRD